MLRNKKGVTLASTGVCTELGIGEPWNIKSGPCYPCTPRPLCPCLPTYPVISYEHGRQQLLLHLPGVLCIPRPDGQAYDCLLQQPHSQVGQELVTERGKGH